MVFGRAPWGTPYHFLLISIISPTAPRVYPLPFPLNPIRSLTASLSYSVSFPSGSHQIFQSLQREPPANFHVNSIMFSEVSRRGPLPFFLSLPSDHPPPPWGFPSEALDAGYFSASYGTPSACSAILHSLFLPARLHNDRRFRDILRNQIP